MDMRIKGVQKGEGGFRVRLLFRILRRKGRVPEPVRIYAHHPGIMLDFLRLARTVRGKGTLSPRLKGLAMHWTARLVACSF
jgi:hypothetical protein